MRFYRIVNTWIFTCIWHLIVIDYDYHVPRGQKEDFMKCRHCGKKLPKGTTYCSRCKKNNFARWQLIVGAVGAVIVLAALAVVLIFGMDLDFLNKNNDGVTVGVETTPAYVSDVDYSGTDEDVDASNDIVVAKVNDAELTNRVLQLYFNLEVYDFINANYTYLATMGLDYTQPLNNQKCYYEDISWEEYFVNLAIEKWRQYQIVAMLAKEDGFELSEETRLMLETMPEDLAENAVQYGYDDVNAWLEEAMMAKITVEDYVEYSTLVAYYSEYIMLEPTEAQLEAYYNENEDHFITNNVGKDVAPTVSVRHILIKPTGGTTDDTGATVYSDEEWAACKDRAQQILNEWKSGTATETSFASMASLYSEDSGSASDGGLYTEITPETGFVEPFLNWCLEPSRRVGETGLVKTEYGYHIMYFSGTEDVWLKYAKQWYAQDREIELVELGTEKWTIEIYNNVICIKEFDVSEE